MPKQVITASTAPIVGTTPGGSASPLAQAIRFGNMLMVSGQGGVDPVTDTILSTDIVVQTRQALDNLMRVLAAAGASARHIVNLRVTLRDIADFPRFDAVFLEFFKGESVTRTCFGAIPNRRGVYVQIDCVAMFDP